MRGRRSARERTKTRVLFKILAGSGVVVRPETKTWFKEVNRECCW